MYLTWTVGSSMEFLRSVMRGIRRGGGPQGEFDERDKSRGDFVADAAEGFEPHLLGSDDRIRVGQVPMERAVAAAERRTRLPHRIGQRNDVVERAGHLFEGLRMGVPPIYAGFRKSGQGKRADWARRPPGRLDCKALATET